MVCYGQMYINKHHVVQLYIGSVCVVQEVSNDVDLAIDQMIDDALKIKKQIDEDIVKLKNRQFDDISNAINFYHM